MGDRVSDSAQIQAEKGQPASERLHAEAFAGARAAKTYLSVGIDAVTSLVVGDAGSRAEVNHYAAGFVKTAALFARGRTGLCGTLAAYALDAMNPADSLSVQALDGLMGGAKGGLLKGTFHLLGKKDLPVASKGVALGVAANAVETGLTRSTYIDAASGNFDLGKGLGHVAETSLSRQSLVTNALVFTAAHGVFAGADRLAGGFIKRSPLAANMVNGFSFGAVSGAGTELTRQMGAGLELDAGSIARRALIQGAVDSFAALPGGVQSDAAFRKQAFSSMESAYYRALWALRDGHTEGRRLTYALLNRFDMRHPLARLGDLIHGSGRDVREPGPRLTEQNNPISAFERELPQYFRDIQKKEALMEQASGREQQSKIYDEMKEIRTKFSLRLLTFWHGKADRPGIVSYSDAELATANTSAERVAQIRKALTLTANRQWPETSPLVRALADLARVDIGSGRGYRDNFQLDEIGIAKGEFFGYDESALVRRMAMPGDLYHKKRHYSTPVDWVPFEPTAKLPNLFHGSVSRSLPSIFRERAMLPASELRLRGIEQATGESAMQEFPRRSVSVTTDFTEAWAYTRHSPEYLTTYPIVLGISREVLPKARQAGMLEPGELLVDRLSLGTSLLTRLGLRKPEVTHIFAPDSQIPGINRLLARQRIKGVSVVGLNELEKPAWKKEAVDEPW